MDISETLHIDSAHSDSLLEDTLEPQMGIWIKNQTGKLCLRFSQNALMSTTTTTSIQWHTELCGLSATSNKKGTLEYGHLTFTQQFALLWYTHIKQTFNWINDLLDIIHQVFYRLDSRQWHLNFCEDCGDLIKSSNWCIYYNVYVYSCHSEKVIEMSEVINYSKLLIFLDSF